MEAGWARAYSPALIGSIRDKCLALWPPVPAFFFFVDPFETPVYVVGLTKKPRHSRYAETVLEMKWSQLLVPLCRPGWSFVGFL